MPLPRVIVREANRSGRLLSYLRGHPWIYSNAIVQVKNQPEAGSPVAVYTHSGKLIGTGLWEGTAIAVRMFHWGEEITPNEHYWTEKLKAALRLRTALRLPSSSTTMFRLVHAEADGIPGTVIDIYEHTAVIALYTQGAKKHAPALAIALRHTLPTLKAIVAKNMDTPQRTTHLLWGKAENPILCRENGFRFLVDWQKGQKTGFFIDQRSARKQILTLTEKRLVLDLFSYTGAFAVYALAGGACHVTLVDSSQNSLELARENIRLNHPPHTQCSVEIIWADVFDWLATQAPQGQFDLVICDPPSFARHPSALRTAIAALKRLLVRCLPTLRNEGIIAQFCCSQVVSAELLRKVIFWAGEQSNSQIHILARTYQAEDHPELATFPESLYLKGFICYAKRISPLSINSLNRRATGNPTTV